MKPNPFLEREVAECVTDDEAENAEKASRKKAPKSRKKGKESLPQLKSIDDQHLPRWLRMVTAGGLALGGVGVLCLGLATLRDAPEVQGQAMSQVQEAEKKLPEMAGAGAVAAKFVTAWLDESLGADTREAALEQVTTKGFSPALPKSEGQASVRRVHAGSARAVSASTGEVPVTVVLAVKAAEDSAETSATMWSLVVPIVWDGTQAAVSAPPSFEGLRTLGDVPARKITAIDDLSAATKDIVTATLTAWASGQEMAPHLAPGSTLRPLGKGLTLVAVDSWTVTSQSEGQCSGLADTTWKLPGGLEVSMRQQITLQEISSTSGQSWRVKSIGVQK